MDQSQQASHKLSNDYSLSADVGIESEDGGVNSFSTFSNSAYATRASLGRPRGHGTIQQPSYDLARRANGNRYNEDASVATDVSSFRPAHNLGDPHAGSISTSPSSGVSPLAYHPPSAYHHGQNYNVVPSYAGVTSAQQQFVRHPHGFVGSRLGVGPEGTTAISPAHTGLTPLPSAFSTLRGSDRESYGPPGQYHLHTQHITPLGYSSYLGAETPRVCPAVPGMPMSPPGPGYHPTIMGRSPSVSGQPHGDCSGFTFPDFNQISDVTCNGQPVEWTIAAKIDKGFFQPPGENEWTCYRRNYFSLSATYTMAPIHQGGRLELHRDGKVETIRAMGLTISASVDCPNGKSIDLIQHTAKRDAGPKTPVRPRKIWPTLPESHMHPAMMGMHPQHIGGHIATFHHVAQPMAQLDFQDVVDVYPDDEEIKKAAAEKENPSSAQSPRTTGSWDTNAQQQQQGSLATASYERVQFKSATANNGKRRASQQYFHIKVEIVVDVREPGSDTPQWVNVANCVSNRVVVRGRSPSHYANEGANLNRNGGRGRGGNTYNAPIASPDYDTYHGSNIGAFRGPGQYVLRANSQLGYTQDQHYDHSTTYALTDSESPANSVDAGASEEGGHYTGQNMPDSDSFVSGTDGYQYCPGPVYEPQSSTQSHLQLPLPKTETQYSTEPRLHAVNVEYQAATPGPLYTAQGIGRYEGFSNSRGLFPNLNHGHELPGGPPPFH